MKNKMLSLNIQKIVVLGFFIAWFVLPAGIWATDFDDNEYFRNGHRPSLPGTTVRSQAASSNSTEAAGSAEMVTLNATQTNEGGERLLDDYHNFIFADGTEGLAEEDEDDLIWDHQTWAFISPREDRMHFAMESSQATGVTFEWMESKKEPRGVLTVRKDDEELSGSFLQQALNAAIKRVREIAPEDYSILERVIGLVDDIDRERWVGALDDEAFELPTRLCIDQRLYGQGLLLELDNVGNAIEAALKLERINALLNGEIIANYNLSLYSELDELRKKITRLLSYFEKLKGLPTFAHSSDTQNGALLKAILTVLTMIVYRMNCVVEDLETDPRIDVVYTIVPLSMAQQLIRRVQAILSQANTQFLVLEYYKKQTLVWLQNESVNTDLPANNLTAREPRSAKRMERTGERASDAATKRQRSLSDRNVAQEESPSTEQAIIWEITKAFFKKMKETNKRMREESL